MIGISFGSKKATQNSSSDIEKESLITGSNSEDKTQTGTTTTSGSSSGTSFRSSLTAQEGAQESQQTSQGTETQTSQAVSLDQEVQDVIKNRVQALFSDGITDGGIRSLASSVEGRVNDFDAAKYVADTVGVARNRGEQTLNESVNGLSDAFGGNPTQNSMAALLGLRGRNDLETNIAGIGAQANMNAQQIINQNLQTASGVQGGLTEQANQTAGVLKGATTTVDTKSLTDQIQALIGKTQATGQTTEQGQESQQTQQVVDQLLQALTQTLSSQQEKTTGSENTTGQTKSGGGFSFSI